MYCNKCGKEIAEYAVVCPGCGAKVEQSKEAPKAELSIPAIMGFMISCFSLLLSGFGICAVAGTTLSTYALLKSGKNSSGRGFAIAGIVIGGVAAIYTSIIMISILSWL